MYLFSSLVPFVLIGVNHSMNSHQSVNQSINPSPFVFIGVNHAINNHQSANQSIHQSLCCPVSQEEAESLRAEVLRLNQAMKEMGAREFAMDNATKQNTDLLKLLMKAEAEVEEVRWQGATSPPVWFVAG